MAIGDIIDIGGRAHMEVPASQAGNENPYSSYAPVMESVAIGSPADEPWDGSAPNATVISLLKALVLAQQ